MLPTCEPKHVWGLWDTQDNCWLGNDDGPLAYRDHTVARAAAQVAEDIICGSDLAGRIQARELAPGVCRLKDEVPAKHTAEESLRRIEGGEGILNPLDPTTHVL